MTNKFQSEQQTIKIILDLARKQGVEDKVKRLIEKFQNAVKGARTEEERLQIGTLGIAEIHKTIGCVGELVVNGVGILPPDSGYQEAINEHKGLVRLD
jgi:hypothetical protein